MPTTASGESAGSVVSRYSSRCVPVASLTNTHRTGTSPHPPVYQCPTPVAASTGRVPPPYHATDSRVRGAVAVACRGLGRPGALDPRPAVAGVRRWWGEQVDVRVALADQRQPVPVAVAEPGHLVGPVGRIPGEHEGAAREPHQEQADQSAGELGRCAGPP